MTKWKLSIEGSQQNEDNAWAEVAAQGQSACLPVKKRSRVLILLGAGLYYLFFLFVSLSGVSFNWSLKEV